MGECASYISKFLTPCSQCRTVPQIRYYNVRSRLVASAVACTVTVSVPWTVVTGTRPVAVGHWAVGLQH